MDMCMYPPACLLPLPASPGFAQTEPSQLLKVLDENGKTIYRVQLPREGRTIFLGWEPSGAALAAVQDHGGAFLWFPSKPDCVQQWEGMQFANQLMRSSALKRNSHFDTCFASWSQARKLVLGLAVRGHCPLALLRPPVQPSRLPSV